MSGKLSVLTPKVTGFVFGHNKLFIYYVLKFNKQVQQRHSVNVIFHLLINGINIKRQFVRHGISSHKRGSTLKPRRLKSLP